MTEPSSYLTATATAYDAVAVLYSDFVRDALNTLPLDRSFLAAFADCVTSAALPGSSGSVTHQPRVMEVGCGPGHVTAHLRDLGLAASGIDLSPALIEIAREAYPDLSFTVGSMGALDVADESLDGILSWYSIIHTPPHELPEYFAEFRRVLAPGGHLLVAFFEAEGDTVLPFDHKVTAAYRWPIDDLAALAKEVDFSEVGRMLREPLPDERHRRGHLILRKH